MKAGTEYEVLGRRAGQIAESKMRPVTRTIIEPTVDIIIDCRFVFYLQNLLTDF